MWATQIPSCYFFFRNPATRTKRYSPEQGGEKLNVTWCYILHNRSYLESEAFLARLTSITVCITAPKQIAHMIPITTSNQGVILEEEGSKTKR